MFTTGNIYFATFFLIVFIIGMIWAYRKDSVLSKIHFKGSYKILLVVGAVFVLLFMFVKMRHSV